MAQGLKANAHSIAISVENCELSDLQAALSAIKNDTGINAESLAALLPEKTVDKFDHYLDSTLQAKNFAAANLDTSQLAVTTVNFWKTSQSIKEQK